MSTYAPEDSNVSTTRAAQPASVSSIEHTGTPRLRHGERAHPRSHLRTLQGHMLLTTNPVPGAFMGSSRDKRTKSRHKGGRKAFVPGETLSAC